MSTPFSYLLYARYGDTFHPFKTLDNLVAYLIGHKAGASFMVSWEGRCLVKALVEDENNPTSELKEVTVSLEDYIEEQPVDRAAIETELDKAMAESLTAFKKRCPNGRPVDQVRCSGDHDLFELDREPLILAEIERRKWKWKTLP